MKKMIAILGFLIVLSTFASAEVTLAIDEPTDGFEYNRSETMEISWSSTNNYDVDRVINSSEILAEDEDGRVVSISEDRAEQVSSGQSTTYSMVIDNQFSDLKTGEWVITVVDNWERYESNEQVYQETSAQDNIQIMSIEDTDSGGGDEGYGIEEGSFNISIVEPSSGSEHNSSDDLAIEWSSLNDKEFEHTLENSELVLYDQDGSSYSTGDLSRGVTLQSGEEDSETHTIGSSNFEDFNSGEWALEFIDKWDDETVNKFVYFDVPSNSEEETSNDSTDDNTTDDDSNVIVDDGNDGDDSTGDSDNTTDDSSDDSTGDSDNTTDDSSDDSTDDSNTDCPDGFTYDGENEVCVEDDSSDSDSDDSNTDCPDGFTYDSESDVCVEDSSDSNNDSTDDGGDNSDSGDSSDSSTDDQSSTGDQNNDDEIAGGNDANTSMLQQEVAAGITIQTLLIGLLAILTLGLLFKRSSYTLKF